MALKPIPVRPEVEGDQERYDADMKHFRENPAAWNPPAGLRDAAAQAVFDSVNADNAAQEAVIVKQIDEELAALDAVLDVPSDPDAPLKRGPGRPRKSNEVI